MSRDVFFQRTLFFEIVKIDIDAGAVTASWHEDGLFVCEPLFQQACLTDVHHAWALASSQANAHPGAHASHFPGSGTLLFFRVAGAGLN